MLSQRGERCAPHSIANIWVVRCHLGSSHRASADMAVVPIVDLVAGRLAGQVRVAVMDFAAADYDLRIAWSVGSSPGGGLPALRLFNTRGELPEAVWGLEKTKGPRTFDEMTAAQHRMKSQFLWGTIMKQIAGNDVGKVARIRGKSRAQRGKDEL